MFCPACGSQYQDNAAFCPTCGTPNPALNQQNAYAQQNTYQQPGYAQQNAYQQPGYAQPGYPQQPYAAPVPQKNTLAIVGFVLVLFFSFTLIGLIISIIAYKKADQYPPAYSYKGLSKAGIIIGSIIIGLAIIGVIIAIVTGALAFVTYY